jgi:hypothetical protein
MKTEKEIRERIEDIKYLQRTNKDDGYISINSVREIVINNLKWVISDKPTK